MGFVHRVQKVRVLKRQEKYCPACQARTSRFLGEICPSCQRSDERRRKANAQEYVANYFRDHPLTIPKALLRRILDEQC